MFIEKNKIQIKIKREFLEKDDLINEIELILNINNQKNKQIVRKCFAFIYEIENFKKSIKALTNKNNITDQTRKKTCKLFDNFFFKAQKFEDSIKEKIIIKKIKIFFRCYMRDFFLKSELLKYSYLKPHGYPGDYEIIEKVYDMENPQSKGIGYFFDSYFHNLDYIQAIRDRKNRLKSILFSYFSSSKKKGIKIFNIASGSCREIRELILEDKIPHSKKITFYLIDQEKQAIKFSKIKLTKAPKNLKFFFINDNVLNVFVKNSAILNKIGKQDFIYSIGLADYLPDSLLILIIKYSFKFLSTDGYFVLAHKNIPVHPSPASDWSADWSFIPRRKRQVDLLIFKALKDQKYIIKCFFENKKRIFYHVIIKKI